MKSLVKYILEEHRYISSSNRQVKAVDPRIILAPLGKDKPEFGTLELAKDASQEIFTYLWETYPDLYTFQNVEALGIEDQESSTKR
jgi:hypothetical protein